jgi:hypothetical protein
MVERLARDTDISQREIELDGSMEGEGGNGGGKIRSRWMTCNEKYLTCYLREEDALFEGESVLRLGSVMERLKSSAGGVQEDRNQCPTPASRFWGS